MLEKMQYRGLNGLRALRRWAIPYFGSRMHPAEFRPLLCYFFTDWKCNIDCHYCFQYDNVRAGMTRETAKSSIDWLKTVGCRVLAIMGPREREAAFNRITIFGGLISCRSM